MNAYSSSEVLSILEQLHTKPESYWITRGQTAALQLFHEMAKRVPAYKDFLKKNNLHHEDIKTIKDFSSVPAVDKQNYLRQYPREMLCWDGEFSSKRWNISTTSGSTGEPFYFPRQEEQDLQYSYTAEWYLRTNFQIHKRSTLYIVGFPMGAWIGGVFTYKALSLLAERGNYPLSIITPGINKMEILKAVKNLGSHFDQILIGSYGPFLKDIIDDGEQYGISWKEYNLGFIFSAEGFSETFRDYVAKKTGLKNIYTDTLNHYGTVDLGTMSHETPICIYLRRLGLEHPEVYKALFGQITKLPTLTQYNPEQFFFEDINGNLYCSSYSGIPLVRYDLKDHGGVIGFEDIKMRLQTMGYTIDSSLQGLALDSTLWNLPFVYVYERSDFSVSFFAFQIYPETIRKALQEDIFEKHITGKFTMQVIYNDDANQELQIHIEKKAGIEKTDDIEEKLKQSIVRLLLAENSEYRKTHEEYPDKTIPKLIFWAYEDPMYFRPGVKQKWVRKS